MILISIYELHKVSDTIEISLHLWVFAMELTFNFFFTKVKAAFQMWIRDQYLGLWRMEDENNSIEQGLARFMFLFSCQTDASDLCFKKMIRFRMVWILLSKFDIIRYYFKVKGPMAMRDSSLNMNFHFRYLLNKLFHQHLFERWYWLNHKNYPRRDA